jgi:hypothetical protein
MVVDQLAMCKVLELAAPMPLVSETCDFSGEERIAAAARAGLFY